MADELQYHPVCTAFPRMTDEAYRKRLEHYRKHPERAEDTAVLLAVDDADGVEKIADGRHHYLICRELGYTVRFEKFEGTRDELADIVEARNADRRHLEPTQIAAAIVALNEFRHGGDRKGEIKIPRGTLIDKAADAGVGRNTLQRASAAAKAAPELLPAMRDGKLDANTAAKVAKLPSAARKKVADAADPKAEAKKQLPKKPKKEPAAKADAPKPAKVVPPPVVDSWGIPIQPHAAEAFAGAALFDALVAKFRDCQKDLTALVELPAGKHLLKHVQWVRSDSKAGGRWVLSHLDNAILTVANAKPAVTDCPYAHNPDLPHPENCRVCHDLRWTGSLKNHQIPPAMTAAMKKHYGVAEGD